MGNQTNLLIWAAAAYVWMVMGVVLVESKKKEEEHDHPFAMHQLLKEIGCVWSI